MTTGAEVLRAIAAVYDEGARKSRSWIFNNDRISDAQVYDAMADEARRQADQLDQETP